MQVRDQLLRLLKLQELSLEIRAASEIVENAPRKLDEIEARFRERNAEYVVLKERFDAVEADERRRSEELGELDERRKKYQEDLRRVTNDREYSAVLREIDGVKAHIDEHEDAIFKDEEETEALKVELAAREAYIQEERQKVALESAEVESETAAARATITELDEKRKQIEGLLTRSLSGMVQRLEAARHGQFLARAHDGVCQCCHVRIRPQVFQEIRQALRIHTCSNCRRILYHEPSLKAPAPSTAAEAPNNVEAINGGAV